ncbi:MAG: MFS transporter [Acidobacteria bacterium]|nr:MFS transporter [Acidobacteriota bacterium]
MSERKVPPAVLALSASHFVTDAYTSIYAPLLPMFIPSLGLSLAQAGTIAMAFMLANSAGQMVFGPLADRGRAAQLVIVGPFLAVAVLSLAGVATSPMMLGTIMVVGSLGNAAFHPASASLVHKAGGRFPGLAMSVHVTGGAVGGAFGPLIFAPYVQYFGLHWTPLLAVPGLLAIAWIQRAIPRDTVGPRVAHAGYAALRPYARPLALLWGAVVIRTVVSLGFSTFLPVLLTGRGISIGAAGGIMGIYVLAGSVGGLAGGPVADRFGSRRVMVWSLLLSVPLQLAAASLHGPAALVALTLGGFFLGSTLPVNVTYAHMIAPVATGTVSSLMLGVAWGAGGMAVPLVGLVGDALGLTRALQMIAWLPALAAALTMLLPPDGRVGRVTARV